MCKERVKLVISNFSKSFFCLSFILPFIICSTVSLIALRASSESLSGRELQVSKNSPSKSHFLDASPDYILSFPRDHGLHRGFQTEWWYYTGHLVIPDQDPLKGTTKYGIQLTFFRRQNAPSVSSDGGQVYLAHAALFDVTSGVFIHSERSVRGALGLAYARDEQLDLYNQGWSVKSEHDGVNDQSLNFRLSNSDGSLWYDVALILKAASNEPILQGDKGFSKKGECQTCASHYYSVAPLLARGTVRVVSRSGLVKDSTKVEGIFWMDHEWMSSGLGSDQTGWDWCWFILSDGTMIMAAQVRGQDRQEKINYRFATVISKSNGTSIINTYKGDEVLFKPIRWWKSPRSGANYPIEVKVAIPLANIDARLKPLSDNQEIDSVYAPTYWEGAILVATSKSSGKGFLELTGYSDKINDL
jgi:predicted secreted hydrolase